MIETKIECSANVWSSSGICIHPLVVCMCVCPACNRFDIRAVWILQSNHVTHAMLDFSSSQPSTIPLNHSFFLLIIYYDYIFIFIFNSKFPHFHFVSFHSFGSYFVQVYKLILSIPSWFTIKMPFNTFTFFFFFFLFLFYHDERRPTSSCSVILSIPFLLANVIFSCNNVYTKCHIVYFFEQNPCSGQMVYEYVHNVYRFSIFYVLAKYLRSLHIDIPHRRRKI